MFWLVGTSHPGQFRYRLQPLVPLWQQYRACAIRAKKRVPQKRGESQTRNLPIHMLATLCLRNYMVGRCMACVMVMCALGMPFILEQPSTSVMEFHPCFQLLARQFKIFKDPWAQRIHACMKCFSTKEMHLEIYSGTIVYLWGHGGTP